MSEQRTYPRRLIEVDMPIKEVSRHSTREQNVRKGHLHHLLTWWAAKPLGSCRTALLATLLPDPADPLCPQSFRDAARAALSELTSENLVEPEALRGALFRFIADLSAWDASIQPTFLRIARRLVEAAHPEGKPSVLDPFGGAGSIPFEALRMGANAIAGDLNPVAVLILKAALEMIPEHRHRLAEEVLKWGNWVRRRAEEELCAFYPPQRPGETPFAYIWTRTIQCEGPGCGAEVPLLGQPILSKKAKDPVVIGYSADHDGKVIRTEVRRLNSLSQMQPPISQRFAVTCPLCGHTTPYKRVREQVKARKGGTEDARLLAVISLTREGKRVFRDAQPSDLAAVEAARMRYESLLAQPEHAGLLMLTEPFPGWDSRAFSPGLWGIDTWGDLFSRRQKLALATYCRLVGEAHREMLASGMDEDVAEAVTSLLAIAVDKVAPYLSAVSIFSSDNMLSAYVQGSGVAMRQDFAEASPLVSKLVGGFDYALGRVRQVLEREAPSCHAPGIVYQGSATSLPLEDDSVSYVMTDPPYYAAVPYADLSDMLYVWLKKALRDIHPDLFRAVLTPKLEELVACYRQPPQEERPPKDNAFFEQKMREALAECRRVLRPDGVAVVLFAHKGTAGWEALLTALVNAGWQVTASWPIDTERRGRMRARDSAALASTVFLVCRPRENPDGSLREEVGDWREVLQELPVRIHEWMPRLAEEGIVGADAIFACLGPAIEIFSRYSCVERATGERVTLREYLEHVWAAVAKEALSMIFEGADASGFEEDSRLTAMWLWTLSTGGNGGEVEGERLTAEDEVDEEGKPAKPSGYVLEYDAARKIAQALGAHLEELSEVVKVKGEKAWLLPVSERARRLLGKKENAPAPKRSKKQLTFADVVGEEDAEGFGEMADTATEPAETTLDRLHQAMLLFAAARGDALRRFLVDQGVGADPKFWRLAQALSALYPMSSEEKRWVDGVQARRKGLGL